MGRFDVSLMWDNRRPTSETQGIQKSNKTLTLI